MLTFGFYLLPWDGFRLEHRREHGIKLLFFNEDALLHRAMLT